MPAAASMGDAVRIKFAGAEVHHLAAVGTVPGVAVMAVAGRNGPGTARIRLEDGGGRLAWRAPGSATWGDPVSIPDDGLYLITDGEDEDSWARVSVHREFVPPSAVEAKVLLADVYANGVAGRDITAPQAEGSEPSDYAQPPLGITSLPPTLWAGYNDKKLYMASTFSSTLTSSLSFPAALPAGIGWTGDSTAWGDFDAGLLMRQSGFTSTTVDSISVGVITPLGVSWGADDLLYSGLISQRLYRTSGFSMTVTDSVSVAAIDTSPSGMSWDGQHPLWCGFGDRKLYRQSGFTSTVLTSVGVGGVDLIPTGITWTGQHAEWCGQMDRKLYRQSGFTSTLSTSVSITSIDTLPSGIGHGSYSERIGAYLLSWMLTVANDSASAIGDVRVWIDDAAEGASGLELSLDRAAWHAPTEESGSPITWSTIAAGSSETLWLRRTHPWPEAFDPRVLKHLQLAWTGA